jgi:tripartite-type tricarboxylate transporter receptor subunit TctC
MNLFASKLLLVRCLRIAILGVAAIAWTGAPAQMVQDGYISLIVPYPAGSASDLTARQLQPAFGKSLGKTVVVENVAGAGGVIALQRLLARPADGSALVLSSPTEVILSPLSIPSARYRPEDFRPVGLVGQVSFALMARPDLPADNVQELVTLSRKSGGRELSYGSVGPGSILHLMGAQFGKLTGVRMLHIPYKGTPPMAQDLMAGQIDLAFLPLVGSVVEWLERGKLKALGTTTLAPLPSFPKLRTLASQHKGLGKFEFDAWTALIVPRKTSARDVLRLSNAFYESLRDPAVRRDMEQAGIMIANPMDLPALDRFYGEQIVRYRGLASGISVSEDRQ